MVYPESTALINGSYGEVDEIIATEVSERFQDNNSGQPYYGPFYVTPSPYYYEEDGFEFGDLDPLYLIAILLALLVAVHLCMLNMLCNHWNASFSINPCVFYSKIKKKMSLIKKAMAAAQNLENLANGEVDLAGAADMLGAAQDAMEIAETATVVAGAAKKLVNTAEKMNDKELNASI